MKRGIKLFGISILITIIQGVVYAASVVSLPASGNSNGFNPYTVFGAGGTNSSNTDNSNALPASNNAVNAQSAQSVNSATSSSTTVTPVSAPAAVQSAAKPPQYVQPAGQVGKFAAPAKKVDFTQTPRVRSNSQTQTPAATGLSQSPGSITNNSLQASGPAPGGLGPTPSGLPPAMNNSAALLEQILANTTSINAVTQNMQNIDQQLNTYWTVPLTDQDYQTFQTVSGYSALANLNNSFATNNTIQQNLSSSTNFASLTGNWENNPTSLNDSLPYLGSLTQGVVENSETNQLWIPAVNTALYDLSVNQSNMTAIGQAVNAPFGGQSSWSATIQSASTPQLLRTLVIEQAIQNALAYQMLQNQQDQEVMQASELAMLAAIHNDLQNSSAEEIRQEKRIVDAIYNSANNK